MAELRRSLAEITDAIRFHLGEPDESLSLLKDATESDRLWALYTQVDNYVQGLRGKMLAQLRAEGISIRDPQLHLPWLLDPQENAMSWEDSSTIYAPAACETLISVYNDITRRNVPIVTNAQRAFPRLPLIAIGVATAEPIRALVASRYNSTTNNGTVFRQEFRVIPPQLNTYYGTSSYPILMATYYARPNRMTLTTPSTTYPDLPEEFVDVLIYGVVASIFGKSHPRYHEFQAKEGELLLAMARAAGAAGRVQGVLS